MDNFNTFTKYMKKRHKMSKYTQDTNYCVYVFPKSFFFFGVFFRVLIMNQVG